MLGGRMSKDKEPKVDPAREIVQSANGHYSQQAVTAYHEGSVTQAHGDEREGPRLSAYLGRFSAAEPEAGSSAVRTNF